MNRTTAALVSVLLVSVGVSCKGETAEKVTEGVIGKGVEVTKGAAVGVGKGIEEGRKGTQSADGSKTLSKPDEVFAAVDIAVHEVTAGTDGTAAVTLAVTSKSEMPVHLIGLQDKGGALFTDAAGFSTELMPNAPGQLGEAIDVPPLAKIKAKLIFKGDATKAAKIRVWGKDLPATAAAAPAASTPKSAASSQAPKKPAAGSGGHLEDRQ